MLSVVLDIAWSLMIHIIHKNLDIFQKVSRSFLVELKAWSIPVGRNTMERIYGLLLFPNSAVMSLSPEDLRFYIEDITDIAEWSTNVHVHIMELKDQHAIDRQVNRRSMPAKLACKRNILSHCMNEY